jgi:hypothetical protein
MGNFRPKTMPETSPLFKRPSGYLLNRLPEAARKRSIPDIYNDMVFVPVRPESLLWFNTKPTWAAEGQGAKSGAPWRDSGSARGGEHAATIQD